MSLKKQKLLYFYTAKSPFVEKDILIFSEQYRVSTFQFNVYQKKKLILILFRQFIFLIRHLFFAKRIVCQFAGLHSVLPVMLGRIFGKKVMLVAGGTDCVSFPSISYGNFANPRNAFFTRICFENCSLILPVHESLVDCEYTYQDRDFPRQGIRYFLPKLKTPIRIVYNGYDSRYWNRGGLEKKKNSFITVLGHLNSRFTLALKGIDLFIEAAKAYPEANFTIVGGSGIQLKNQPNNLILASNVWGDALVKLFAEQQFYVQLSMSEGFPNALSEAMLCECVPIVSNVGGMPDIVGNCGFILQKRDFKEVKDLFTLAINDPHLQEKETCSRERISRLFTLEMRQKGMRDALHYLENPSA